MPLKESGVRLVAENYTTYLRQMKEINRAHQQAFSGKSFAGYSRASQKIVSDQQKLQQSTNSTWNVVQNLRSSFNSAATSGSRLGNIGAKISNAFSGLGGSFSNAASGLGKLTSGMASFALKASGILFLLEMFQNLTQFLVGAGDLAARVETLGVALEEVGVQSGYTTQQIDVATQLLRDQGITTQAAQKSLLKMARAEISFAEATKLANIAQGSAVVAGMNSSQAFERLITGIQKMEPELLDELGINLRRSDAYKKMADELGVSTKQLTEQQKQQAILNEIYAQSEVVMEVYNKAQETTGKQEKSLARLMEETQLNVGKAIIAFKRYGVVLQTDFWKSANKATAGFSTLGSAISLALKAITNLITSTGPLITGLSGISGTIKEGEESYQSFGHVIFDFGKTLTLTFAAIDAATTATFKNFGENVATFGKVWYNFTTGNFMAGVEELKKGWNDVGTTFDEELRKNMEAAIKANPELLKSWKEVTAEMDEATKEIDLNPKVEEQKNLTDATEEATEALEEQLKIFKRIESIQMNFAERMADAQKKAADDIKDFETDIIKSRDKLEEKHAKERTKFEEDATKERANLIKEFNKDQRREQKKLHDDLERERRRFQLTQMQETRRFQVEDRRLRAEGDVLALMRLREDFDLQQKEQKENFEFGQKEQKKTAQEESKIQQEDMQTRLRELDAQLEERKKELQNSYTEELEQLNAANAEKRAEIERANQERIQAVIDARNEELQELGRSLQDEQKITEEGMQAIAEEISKVFGDEGAGSAMIAGFRERSTTEIGRMIIEMQEQLRTLEEAANETAERIRAADFGFTSPDRGGSRGGGARARANRSNRPGYPRPFGMREGGVGVVTGPAMFEVEPGQREAVMFAPLPTMSQNLNVSMSGGFDIRGAESVGREATEAAIDQMVQEFMVAVDRLSRRGR